MVFPWTTVDSVLNKFNQAVEDLDTLAENALHDASEARQRAAFWQAKAQVHDQVKERAKRIAAKINDLVA